MTAGPLTRQQLDDAVNVPGGRTNSTANMLKQCNFELAAQAVDFQGEVFVSPKTWKLYFVISVDTLMIDSK